MTKDSKGITQVKSGDFLKRFMSKSVASLDSQTVMLSYGDSELTYYE